MSILKEFHSELSDFLHVSVARYRLRVAVFLANNKQRAYNKRYFVLPDHNHKLRVLCNDEINALKSPLRRKVYRKGHYDSQGKWKKGGIFIEKHYRMNKKVSYLDVMRECFYYTPMSLNNTGAITPDEKKKKESEWVKYNDDLRRRRRNAKAVR